jgi:dihydrofolate reductase
MRKVVYSVATSLDGFIAGPIGELDWIVMDSDFDFNEVFQKFDTILVGRKTFEPMAASGQATMPGMTTLVFSRTLRPADHPDVTLVASDAVETVNALRSQPGKDIWLYGGGSLFASLVSAGLVDSIGLAIMPVMLGAGVPVMPQSAKRVELRFVKQELLEKTGVVSVEYDVVNARR